VEAALLAAGFLPLFAFSFILGNDIKFLLSASGQSWTMVRTAAAVTGELAIAQPAKPCADIDAISGTTSLHEHAERLVPAWLRRADQDRDRHTERRISRGSRVQPQSLSVIAALARRVRYRRIRT
jgi:hypothetical protein